MYEQLCKTILPTLIPYGAKVLVAVSGGPDSMALSHILWRYAREEKQRRISIVLTHVHHGVRKESDDEVRLVQTMAKEWGLPCCIHRFDAKQHAKTVGQSFQEAARAWRYARWKEDMARDGCSLLATAHHLGDQAETILFRLLRGSGTAGLGGMYPSKDSVIRPLLYFTKADILQYCKREGIPFALDQSNEEPVYTRNRIRLELLPELEKNYNSRIQEVLGRTGELLRWDEDYLSGQVDAAWNRYYFLNSQGDICLRKEVFKEPAAILSRLLRKAGMLVTGESRGMGFAYVTKIMDSQGKPGWAQDLPGLRVKIQAEGLQFSRDKAPAEPDPNGVEIPLSLGVWQEIPDSELKIGLWKSKGFDFLSVGKESKIAVFGPELEEQALLCRTRRQADKMWFGGIGHKSLKKVFQEANIEDKARQRIPLMACGSEVLWIPGVRQSGRYPAEDNEEKIVCILTQRAVRSNLDSL